MERWENNNRNIKIRIRSTKWSNIGVKSERKWSKYFKGKYIEIGDCNKE